jgi:hypothetical protein
MSGRLSTAECATTLSSDGKRITLLEASLTTLSFHIQPDLRVGNEPGAAPKNLTETYDFDIGGGIEVISVSPRLTRQ